MEHLDRVLLKAGILVEVYFVYGPTAVNPNRREEVRRFGTWSLKGIWGRCDEFIVQGVPPCLPPSFQEKDIFLKGRT